MRPTIRFVAMIGMFCGCLWASGVVRGELQVGDAAPEFHCLDEAGNLWHSREHVGKQFVVLYFYRSDFTFCCTRQGVRYRDSQQEFAKLGAEVVGVSGDSVESHCLFKGNQQLSQSLLADTEGLLAQKFGVPVRCGGKAMAQDADGKELRHPDGKVISFPRTVTAERWTFVIDRDGRIIYREANVSPVHDSRTVLEFLRTR